MWIRTSCVCLCRFVMFVASHLNSAGVKSENLGISKMQSRSMARFVMQCCFMEAFSNLTKDTSGVIRVFGIWGQKQ